MTAEAYQASLAAFEAALARLEDALKQPKTEWTRDAAIQRFEFTFELAWKNVMRFARREGLQLASPRQAWRAALQLGWIGDDEIWLDMLEDRNRSSHTYNEQTAEEIFSRLPRYYTALTQLLGQLKLLVEPGS